MVRDIILNESTEQKCMIYRLVPSDDLDGKYFWLKLVWFITNIWWVSCFFNLFCVKWPFKFCSYFSFDYVLYVFFFSSFNRRPYFSVSVWYCFAEIFRNNRYYGQTNKLLVFFKLSTIAWYWTMNKRTYYEHLVFSSIYKINCFRMCAL